MDNIPDEIPEIYSRESFDSLSPLELALYYSRVLGLSVIPISTKMELNKASGIMEPVKKPNLSELDPYLERKPTEEELAKWFGSGNNNMAIVAGKNSNIIVLDVDSYKKWYDGKFFMENTVPDTWTVITWQWWRHYYFKFPEWLKVKNADKIDAVKFVECKVWHKYLLVPASKYVDGDRVLEYQWAPGLEPWSDVGIAEAPDWLINLIADETPSPKKTVTIWLPVKHKNWDKILQEVHTEWERNNMLASVAWYIFRKLPEKDWEEQALPFLFEYNATKLDPPLSLREAKATIHSIMNIEKKRREVEWDDGKEVSTTVKASTSITRSLFVHLSKNTELIVDQQGRPIIVDILDPRKKLYFTNSEDFMDFIYFTVQEEFWYTTCNEVVLNVTSNLRARAKGIGKKVNVWNRLGYLKSENTIYYDLNNDRGEVVEITEDSVTILPQKDGMYFERFSIMWEQVHPRESRFPDKIWDFFNIQWEEEQLLFMVYLISLFIPHIRLPMLVLNGDAWSWKTTCFRFIKSLVDPALSWDETTINSPKDLSTFQLQLTQWYFHCYDNLSELKGDVPNLLCEAITWGSFRNRKNYSDENILSRKFTARLGIGSIDTIIWRDDLIDRSLMFDLRPFISKDSDEEDFYEEFMKYRPEILYNILCIVWKALWNTDTIRGLPRMGDFWKWWEKIARALGYDDGVFLEAYKERLKKQKKNIKLLLIPQYITDLLESVLEKTDSWTWTPSDLFEHWKNVLKLMFMPNEISGFCRILYHHTENLRILGIEVNRRHSTNRTIQIRKIGPVVIPKIKDTSDTSDTKFGKSGGDTPLSPNPTNMP